MWIKSFSDLSQERNFEQQTSSFLASAYQLSKIIISSKKIIKNENFTICFHFCHLLCAFKWVSSLITNFRNSYLLIWIRSTFFNISFFATQKKSIVLYVEALMNMWVSVKRLFVLNPSKCDTALISQRSSIISWDEYEKIKIYTNKKWEKFGHVLRDDGIEA